MDKAPPGTAAKATARDSEAGLRWPQAGVTAFAGGGCAGGEVFGDVAGASVAPEVPLEKRVASRRSMAEPSRRVRLGTKRL